MTTLTTHDTKRSEDAVARISVLAEISDEWAETFARLRKLSPPPDGPLAELIWQAAIGAWPLSRDRLSAYALKAAREAGTSTSWTTPDPRFEQAVQAMVDDAYDHPDVVEELESIVDLVRRPGWSNSLAAKLIQLTAPGVPDVYQGTEVWDTSLVDPDNRRPIDFASRRALLAAVRSTLPPVDDTGAAKLLVTTTALRYRRVPSRSVHRLHPGPWRRRRGRAPRGVRSWRVPHDRHPPPGAATAQRRLARHRRASRRAGLDRRDHGATRRSRHAAPRRHPPPLPRSPCSCRRAPARDVRRAIHRVGSEANGSDR